MLIFTDPVTSKFPTISAFPSKGKGSLVGKLIKPEPSPTKEPVNEDPEKFVASTLPSISNEPVSVILPDTPKDPVTECDPVKYLKLLSNSSIVKADPLPPEPVLYVNAIFY